MKPGIYDIPAAKYHRDPCETPSLSASVAKLLVNQSPLHAWTAHPRLNPDYMRVEKAAYDLGMVVHELLLQGSLDCLEVIEANDFRTKAAQEARDAAYAAGRVPLLAKDVDRARAMVDAVNDQMECRDDDPPLLTSGKPEQTLVWEDNGVTCRALVDWLHDDFSAIDDAKTTARSADPRKWSRQTLWEIGADIQVAFNIRGVYALTGMEPVFRYVLIECQPPYALSVVTLSLAALEVGMRKAEYAIRRFGECLESETWPGYPSEVYEADAPLWEVERVADLTTTGVGA